MLVLFCAANRDGIASTKSDRGAKRTIPKATPNQAFGASAR